MKYSIKHDLQIKKRIDEMDAETLLRTVVCPQVANGDDVPRATGAAFIHPKTTDEACAIAKKINDEREMSALIVSDMEFGPGDAIKGAVKFPSMRAVAETGDPSLAYQMGEIAAKQARSAGYHWTFGPCVDIVLNPYNPIVTTRSPGETADAAIEYGGAYVDGLQENGLIATLKHFPGDGCSLSDQHITTTANPLSREQWDETYGRVYKALIDRGAMTIMAGHIALPAYDEPDQYGLYPPATMSKNLLTGLLREKLGFEGLIVSDACNMGGFCGYMNFYRGCCEFLKAGGDCLLFVRDTDEYLTEMKQYLADGTLPMDVLKDRAYRLLCFANDYFEKFPAGDVSSIDLEKAEACAKTVAQKAVKITRDREGLLPLKIKENSKIAHAILHPTWLTDFSCPMEVSERLSKYAEVETLVDPGGGTLREMAKSGKYDYIICSVLEMGVYGTNTARLVGPAARNMMSGWMRYGTPVVFIGYGNPYFALTYDHSVDTIINTFGYTEYTAEAVVKRLLEG